MNGVQIYKAADELLSIIGYGEAVRDHKSPGNNFGHLRWMCIQIKEFAEAGRVDKAQRWLGFVQGACWILGMQSVEDSKRQNMPIDSVYNQDII